MLRRAQVLEFFAGLPTCFVGKEACGSAHYWARELQALGHEVRLIPPQCVQPFVKTNKYDAADAEAISKASAVVMNETHLMNAICYVSINPVRAGLVSRAQDWPWSGVRAHLASFDDRLTSVQPVLYGTGDFAAILDQPRAAASHEPMRRAEVTGGPVGDCEYLDQLEARLGRQLQPQRRGRKQMSPDVD
ncbi:MAG: transposase [Rhizobiales bacterium]|nr:transposase [Hyphomicrobiales bacterium]